MLLLLQKVEHLRPAFQPAAREAILCGVGSHIHFNSIQIMNVYECNGTNIFMG